MSEHPASNEPIPDLTIGAEELYEMAPCGFVITAADGRIVKVNKTLTEWLGYQREELIGGARFMDLLTVGGRIFYETHLNLLLRVQRAADEIALDIVCKDGRVLPSLINARQINNAGGEPALNCFTVFNASERRLYERELLAARDLLRTTLSSIGDGVVATDAAGLITFMNPVAEQLSGWNSGAALGKPAEDVLVLVHEVTARKLENPIMQALRHGKPAGMADHTVLIPLDGRRIPIDDSAAPILDSSGEVIGAVLVLRDVSPQRAAANALRDAHRQLERVADELRRSNQDLSNFAHVASHDLRSPLNTIVQFAQLLEIKYGEALGEGKELLDFIMGAINRMRRLIDDLLSYAVASAEGTQSAGFADTNAQVRKALENLRGAIEESGAVITQDPLPEVPVSETSLVQIFQNLIGNAINYRSSEAPRIHISASEVSTEQAIEERGMWLFSCRDNGIGIAPEYQDQIFDPFKRLHGADRPGSGIGLAVCKRIIERNKGTIWVQSQAGQGSTFFFTLPKLAKP